jgi:hypothetical protein
VQGKRIDRALPSVLHHWPRGHDAPGAHEQGDAIKRRLHARDLRPGGQGAVPKVNPPSLGSEDCAGE